MKKLLLLFSLLTLFGVFGRADVVEKFTLQCDGDNKPVATPDDWKFAFVKTTADYSATKVYMKSVNENKTETPAISFFNKGGALESTKSFTNVKSITIYGYGTSSTEQYQNVYCDVQYSIDNGTTWKQFAKQEDLSFISNTASCTAGRVYFKTYSYYKGSSVNDVEVQPVTLAMPEEDADKTCIIRFGRINNGNQIFALSQVDVNLSDGKVKLEIPEIAVAADNTAFSIKNPNESGKIFYCVKAADAAAATAEDCTTEYTASVNIADLNLEAGEYKVYAYVKTDSADNDDSNIASASFVVAATVQQEAGLVWKLNGEAVTEVTVKYGDDYVLPVLEKATDASVTYTSSDAEIAKYAEAGTSGLKWTISKAGEVTITATTPETADYKAGEASFRLTIEKADKVLPDVAWSYLGQFGTTPAFGKFTPEEYTLEYGTPIWSSATNRYKVYPQLVIGNHDPSKFQISVCDAAGVVKATGTANQYSMAGQTSLTAEGLSAAATYRPGSLTADPQYADRAIVLIPADADAKISGTTIFKVEFLGDDEYAPKTYPDYKFTVTEAPVVLPEAGLVWKLNDAAVSGVVSVKIGEEPYVFPTLDKATDATVTYTSSNPAVATIAADGTIALVEAGTTTITALAEANANFAAGEAKYTLEVVAADVELLPANLVWYYNDANGDRQAVGETYTVETGQSSYITPYVKKDTDAAVTITSSNTDVVGWTSQFGGMFIVKGVPGTAEITATTPANTKYEAGEAKFTFIVKEAGTVELLPAGLEWKVGEEAVTTVTLTYGEQPYALPELAQATDATATITSSDDAVIKVSATGGFQVKGVGTAILTATTPATDKYEAGEAKVTIEVKDASAPELLAAGLEWKVGEEAVTTVTLTYGEQPYALPELVKTTDAAATITSSDDAVIKVAATGGFQVKGVGTAILTATTPATDKYEAGEAKVTIVVKEAAPVLLDAGLEWRLNGESVNGQTVTITYGEEPYALPSVFKVTNANTKITTSDKTVASWSGTDGIIIVKAAGTAVFTVTAPANATYAAGEASFTLVVEEAGKGELPAPKVTVLGEQIVIERTGDVGQLTYYNGRESMPANVLDSQWISSDEASVTIDCLEGNNYVFAYTKATDPKYTDSQIVVKVYSYSSVYGVEADVNAVKVINGTIIIPEDAAIYTSAGVRVDGVNAAAGVYVVRLANGRTVKVLVK